MRKSYREENGEKVFRYSIRKYHFGAASVAVAALMFFANGAVKADPLVSPATANAGVTNLTEGVPPKENPIEKPKEKVEGDKTPVTQKLVDKSPLVQAISELQAAIAKADEESLLSLSNQLSQLTDENNRLLNGENVSEGAIASQVSRVQSLTEQVRQLKSKTEDKASNKEDRTDSKAQDKKEIKVSDKVVNPTNQNEENKSVQKDDNKGEGTANKDKLESLSKSLITNLDTAKKIERPETKKLLEGVEEIVRSVEKGLENPQLTASEIEELMKQGKQAERKLALAVTREHSGSRDPRNGNKMLPESYFRAASISPTWDSSDNLLIYQRHRASDGSRVVRNGLTEYTENKVDMFAKMTTIGGERYVVYDVFFNNNATGMAKLSRYQIYRLILPPQILDLNSDGTYKGNTLKDLKFETYTRNSDSGTLSQNPERFTRTASYNVNFLNNSVDYGSGWRRLTYFNALDIRHGAEYNGDMRDTFKGNSNDPLLIYAVTRTESKYNRWSYGFGVKTEDKTSAVHMQVKAKLKAGVTDDQVRDAFALAVVGTFGATTNQAYTFISGRDASEPKYTDYPDQPVQPTLREKQAKLYPIQGSSHTKVVGDTIPNTGNPVADKYITRKGSGDFPAGMNWSWKNNAAPSTANAGKFTYTAVASYQDGSTSEDANSGSDGRVYFTINPKKPTITTSVVNKKGLANQTIEVNVGSGVKNGSVVKLYDGDRVIGQGTSNGTTARITVSEALPGNPLKAETTVDSGGIVVSEKSDAVTPTEAPDTQAPTLAITPANQTVVEGETVTFTVTARDNKIVNLDAGDFLTKYSSRVFSGTASVTSPTDTDTEKIRRITITTTAEDVGKTNTITFNATDNANHRATPASFTFTVTRRDNTPPTITAGDATVTSREPITPISVTAVDNPGGVGMRDNNPIEVTGLPSGLTYANNRITGTPTGAPGNSTVAIKAYDKNGNMAPKTITITVRSQADAHNPTGAGLTVNQNYTITDDELRAKVSNYTPGTLSIVSKPSTATAGNAGNAVVKVTYPDGTSDNVDVPVTVTDVTGPTITANDATVTKNEAITAIPVRAVDNTGGVGMRDNNPIEVTNVPAGLTYANNQITGTPTAGIGYYTVTIKAYDKNNRSTTKQIRITVQGQSEKYNPTGTGLTVEQNHTITDDELKAKVSNYAPGTLSIVSRPSTATAGNAGNAVVKVTYSDGTFDNVNVPITVTDVTGPTITAEGTTVTSREQITPISVTAVDNTGGVGMRQNNPIEVTGLPAGLTYANNQITGTPTGPAGNSTVTIKAYDRNNTPTTKEITITVQSQATKYNPTGTGLTVEQNHTITDAELYGKVSNYAPGTLSIVSKPSTTNAGDAGNAVVKVTYPDGTSDNVDVPVTVTDVTGPTITAEEMTVTKNEDIIPPIPISAEDNPGGVGMRDTNPITVTNLPSGLTYSNGNITGRTSVRKGYYTLTITAYDKNNRSSTKKVRLNVQEQADKYTPTATELTVNQNEDITIEKLTPKVSNPGAGTLSLVSKPSTATAGNAGNAVVKVTYSDGSYDSVNVPITVKDVTGPTITANNATVTNREDITPIPVTAEDNTGGVGMRDTNPIVVTGLPEGLTYANGKITGKPTGTAGESTVTITAYDKNDNPTTTTIKITVQSQADAHNPRGERLTVDKDHPIEDAEVIAKVKDYAPATQLTVKSKPSTATVGDVADAVVTVTYPDESSEDVNVPVTVRDVLVPDTTGPTITANGATVTKNEPIDPILVTAEDNPGGVGMRDNDPIVVRGLPNGLTFTDGKITGTPTADKGEYSVTIEAFDKINNRSEAPITIKIIVQEQKEKYNPTGEGLTVNQGHEITDDEVKAKVKDFGPGTLTVTSKPSTTTAGNAGNAVVTVGYPDGSSDTVNVPVTVKDVTGPTVTVGGATVTKNEPITPIPVTVSDNTGGRGLRDNTPVEVTGLPGGLTYSNGEITGTPTVPKGDYSVTITAYDKDGNPTTETITIKVQEQADKYNPTGEGLTVNQGHEITDDEVKAKVKDFGPGTLTVTSKPSTTTAGNAGNAVVTVGYPDGSSDTVNVPVTVKDVTGPTVTVGGATVTKNEPITPIPVTVSDNTGGRGLRDNTPVEVTGLPGGLTYSNGEITGTPTVPKGDYSVTITAYDKDGNPTTVTITIKVQEQADKYNPTGEGLTVNQGHEITDDEVKAKVKDFGPGTLTVTSKPSTTTAGNAGNAVVTVGYPDGSSDTVNVPVTVKDVTGPTVTVGGATVTKNEPITPIPVTVSDNTGGRGLRDNTPVEVTGLPGGLTYSNGEITGTPTVPKGDYSVTITAYDKDGNPTTETITIKVQEQADKYNPTGEGLTVNQGHEITDDEVKAKVKDFGPGTLTVTSKPSTTTAGNAGNAIVTVGYPDGSSDTVNVPVTVKDVTGPTVTVGGATVTKNEPITPIPVTVSDNTGGRGLRDNTPVEVTGLPGGLTYSNGEITGTPTVPKGDYSVTITAYDKDGNPTTETITIKVQEQADKYNPKYGDGKGKPGASVEIPVGEANGKTIPSGTTYTSGTSGIITVDGTTGKVTVTIPSDKNPGDKVTGKVLVHYPDGSTEEVPVSVTVINRDKDDYTPQYNDGNGKPGASVEIPVGEANGKTIPSGTTYTSGTPGIITVDGTTGKVTVTIPSDKNPGDKVTGKVLVHYPDGSTEEVPVSVTVINRDKDDYTPQYNDGNGKPGVSVEIPVGEANGKTIPSGTTYTSGTPGIITVDGTTGKVTVTIPSDKNPGDKVTGKVLVRYPDGSEEEVPVSVTVINRDKDDYTPKYDDGKGKPGASVDIPVSETNGKTIPSGTTYTSGTPGIITVDGTTGKVTVTIPADKNPGDKVTGKVLVRYPDGSTEEVPVSVTVINRDKDDYTPKYDDGKGKPGASVEIPVGEANGKTIPSGTTYTSGTPGIITVDGTTGKVTVTIPSDKNPGDEVTGKVLVRYPDGSTEEVPVTVTVTPPEKLTPTVELEQDPKTGDVTVTPKRPDGSTYPPGTKVEIPGKNGTPIVVIIGQDGKGKVPNSDLPDGKVPGTAKITEPGKPTVEVPVVTTPAKLTPTVELEQDPKTGDVTVTPKRPDGSTYPPGTKVEIPGKNGTPIVVIIGQDGKGKVPNSELPDGKVPGTAKITEPGKPTVEVPVVTTPAKLTPTVELEQDPDSGDVTVTPKKQDGSTYPPGTKVEIPGKNGTPIVVTIGEDGKGKVPNNELPDADIPGTGKITEPGKPTVEVPVVTTPAKLTPTVELEQDPKTGDVTVTPKKPDGSTYPPGTKVEIPGKNGTPIVVIIGQDGKGTVPNSDLPEGKVPGTGKITEPGKPTVEVPVVTTPAKLTPTVELEQDPKTGDVTVTPKKPDGSTYPPGTKVEIPGKNGTPIVVIIGQDGKGKVPNSDLPDGKVPGVAKITEPGKPTVEVPVVTTPAKLTPTVELEQDPKTGDVTVTPATNGGSGQDTPVPTPAPTTPIPDAVTPNADQVDTKTTNDNGAKSNESQNVLPNTGTESNATLASLGLLGLLSGFGLVARKKKED